MCDYRSIKPSWKDIHRIEKIVKVYKLSEKEGRILSTEQANSINNPYKAIRRGKVALLMGDIDVSRIFFQRVVDLGKKDLLNRKEIINLDGLDFANIMGLPILL